MARMNFYIFDKSGHYLVSSSIQQQNKRDRFFEKYVVETLVSEIGFDHDYDLDWHVSSYFSSYAYENTVNVYHSLKTPNIIEFDFLLKSFMNHTDKILVDDRSLKLFYS